MLDPGENKIRVVAKNRIGETAKEVIVFLQAQAQEKRGDLYLVSVGVSDNDIKDLKLDFAAADASAFHAAIKQQTANLYKNIHERLLESPTGAQIQSALELFKQATPADTLILFLAGHGTNQKDGYYFVPRDVRLKSGTIDIASLFKWNHIQDTLVNARGQRIMFVDTCHSAAAINPRLIKDAADNSILVFSATDANTAAQERSELQHGVFTYAILEGLSGKADLIRADKRIMLKELDAYVSSRVTELTEDAQVPTIHTPGGFKDFVFAVN